MYTLYYAPGACSLASHIALEEAGAAFRPVRVDFARSEQQGEDYRAVNPKARVPSLVTSRGVLTETPAILAFISQDHPDAGLAPLDDSFAFARMQAFNSYLCSTVHVAHAHRGRASRWDRRTAGHGGPGGQGAGKHGGMLRADRGHHAARTLGDGRDLYRR